MGARPNLDISTLAHVLNLLFRRLLEEPEPDAAATVRLVDCLAAMIYHRLFEEALKRSKRKKNHVFPPCRRRARYHLDIKR
jgi:hypothetical protein